MVSHSHYPEKQRGRGHGKNVKKEDLKKMVELADEGWGWGYIGKKFGITGTQASRRVRNFRGELKL